MCVNVKIFDLNDPTQNYCKPLTLFLFQRSKKIELYRFPSLFEVDTFLKYWTAKYYEFANKKTKVRLKLKDYFFEKGTFWTANKRNRR